MYVGGGGGGAAVGGSGIGGGGGGDYDYHDGGSGGAWCFPVRLLIQPLPVSCALCHSPKALSTSM